MQSLAVDMETFFALAVLAGFLRSDSNPKTGCALKYQCTYATFQVFICPDPATSQVIYCCFPYVVGLSTKTTFYGLQPTFGVHFSE